MITLLSLLDRVDCDYATGALRDGQIDIFEEDQVPSNIDHIYKACTNVNVDDKYGYCEKPICWETFVGQQFYKLTLVDLFVQVLTKSSQNTLIYASQHLFDRLASFSWWTRQGPI